MQLIETQITIRSIYRWQKLNSIKANFLISIKHFPILDCNRKKILYIANAEFKTKMSTTSIEFSFGNSI